MTRPETTHGNKLGIQLVELVTANNFVSRLHRHHKPVVGHRFSLGCYRVEDNILVGVCICGRPVARMAGDPLEVMEVARVCTDGEKNACSFLLGAAARISKEMGFRVIQTYILETEAGKSLTGAGWVKSDKTSAGGAWKHTDGKIRNNNHPLCPKQKYFKVLKREWKACIVPGNNEVVSNETCGMFDS